MKHKLDDNPFIQRLKDKDKSAYSLLFDTYFERLYLFAYTFVSREDIANDIVQEVFISVWEKSKKLSENTTIKSYLFTLVRNRCLNYIRDLKVEDKNKRLYVEAHIYSDSLEMIEDEELIDKIKKFISDLSPQCQEIFKMRIMYGYKYIEIAEEADVSINTVKTQLKRANDKLKIKFIEYNTLVIIFFIANHFRM